MGKKIYFTGTGSGRSYNYNNTTYIVSSRFSPIGDGPFMRDSLESLLKNDFVHWTDDDNIIKIESNEMHPSVGKEDYETE